MALTKEQIQQQANYISIAARVSNNCKLSVLTNVSVFSNKTMSDEDKKEIFNIVLSKSFQIVYLNSQYKEVADFFIKNYELYGYCEIPVGYEENPIQYHIFVKNNMRNLQYMRDPIKTVIEINPYKDNFIISNENPMIKIIDNRKNIKNTKSKK